MAREGHHRGRRAAFAMGVVGAAALLWVGLVRDPGAGEEGGWAVVRRGDLVLGAELTGTLEAVDSDLLGPPQIPQMWNYKLAYLAPEGAEVAAGTPVVRFDASDLERKLLEKEAERDSAEKELEKKRTDLERKRRDAELELAEARADLKRLELQVDVPPELQKGNEVESLRIDTELATKKVAYLERKADFDRREGKAEQAALEEKRNRAAGRVEEIRGYIRRMTVTAPRAGTVIYVANSRGDKKKPGDQVWQQEKVVEIPDLSRMRVEAEVDEADAGKVAPGQRVSLRLDAHPDLEYTGRVAKIHRTVKRKSRTNPLKVVRLDVALDRTDEQRMRPGMRVRGRVEIERVPDVLLVPAEAVFATASGPLAFRRGFWGEEEVHPTLGRRNGSLVEVVAGLRAGDRLARRLPEGWEGAP